MLSIDEGFLGRTVDLAMGQVMELRLEENPTTGFRWSVVSDGAPACEVVASRFQAKGTAPGRGGEHAWQFRAVRAGECDIELLYRRAWDQSAEPARVFKVRVRVRS